ncbi:MAG: YfhO family protein [Lachnospiraceae bacterium]|nr:YfhO family protein [Lachnospiraceae bacterium]
MWNKYKNWRKENKIFITAFWLPFLAMMIIFAGNDIYPFGDRSFLHIDMYHQYLPMLTDMYRAIKGIGEGSGLLYSWNAGLGSNFIAEAAYYLASPTNILSLLFGEYGQIEFMTYMVPVKIGLSSAFFAYYLYRHYAKKDWGLVAFGMFYSMSAFIAAYNWDVMWLDPFMLTPLIILGVEELALRGKCRLYTCMLGLAVFSNYYLCIMICIFLVLYFLIILLPKAEKKIRTMVRFALFSFLGGCMGGVLLIPEICALQLSKFSASTFPKTAKTYFAVFDELARHLMDVEVETGLDHWPNLFCSVSVLILVPAYIILSHTNVREKLGRLAITAFLLISFSSNVLTFIWHGLNYPDSLPARQSFLYIFMLLIMAYEAYMNLDLIKGGRLVMIYTGTLVFLVMCQKLVDDDALTGRSYALSAVFITAYTVIFYILSIEKGRKLAYRYVFIMAVLLEMGLNMVLTSVPTVSRDNYLESYRTYNKIYKAYNELEDGQFYRFENVDNRVRTDDSMLHNYMSASLFSSTGNGLVNAFYQKYGMRSSKVFYCYDGATPLMSSLLSVKYLYMKYPDKENSLIEYVDSIDGVSLYKYRDSLPMGYMLDEKCNTAALVKDRSTAFDLIDGDIDNKIVGHDAVDYQNTLANDLGAVDTMYSEIYASETDNNIFLTTAESGYLVAYCNNKKVNNIRASVGDEVLNFKKNKNPYILNLGYVEAGTNLNIYNNDTATSGESLNITIYRFNEDVYRSLIERLSKETMVIDSFSSDKVTGHISTEKGGDLILSIPYDPGMKISVDGKKADTKVFAEMMIAVELAPGEHTIEMKYFPQGLVAGAVVTLLAIVFSVLLWYSKLTEGMRKHLEINV